MIIVKSWCDVYVDPSLTSALFSASAHAGKALKCYGRARARQALSVGGYAALPFRNQYARAGYKPGSPSDRRGRCRSTSARLRCRGQVTDPRIHVVTLGREGMDAEAGAPCGPCLKVAAVDRRGASRVGKEPGSGQAKERIVGRSARQPVERFGAHGGDRGSDVDDERHQGHVGEVSRRV